jgi:sugar phosphate isomerase/epimerase
MRAVELPPIGLCWGTVNQADFAELIEAAARHGFPTISIAPNLYHDALAAGLSAAGLRRRLADAGVRVRVIDGVSTGMPGLPSDPIPYRGRWMERYDAATCIEVADAVGAPFVNVSHYRGEPTPLEVIATAAAAASRLAAERGIGIALEFIPDSGIPDLAAGRAVAEMSGEPNCTVLLDTWHLARTGGTADDVRALPPGIIGAFQLADRIEPEPGAPYVPMSGRTLPGEGELPLDAIVATVLANNPAVTIELEVFSEELCAMTVDAAAARTAAAVKAWRASLA